MIKFLGSGQLFGVSLKGFFTMRYFLQINSDKQSNNYEQTKYDMKGSFETARHDGEIL